MFEHIHQQFIERIQHTRNICRLWRPWSMEVSKDLEIETNYPYSHLSLFRNFQQKSTLSEQQAITRSTSPEESCSWSLSTQLCKILYSTFVLTTALLANCFFHCTLDHWFCWSSLGKEIIEPKRKNFDANPLAMMNIIRYLDWNLATRGSYTSYSHDPAGQWQWLDVSLQKVFNIISLLIISTFSGRLAQQTKNR